LPPQAAILFTLDHFSGEPEEELAGQDAGEEGAGGGDGWVGREVADGQRAQRAIGHLHNAIESGGGSDHLGVGAMALVANGEAAPMPIEKRIIGPSTVATSSMRSPPQERTGWRAKQGDGARCTQQQVQTKLPPQM